MVGLIRIHFGGRLRSLIHRFSFLPRSLGPISLVATACVCIFLGGLGAQAQTFDASNLREPVDLGAKWLIHAGDDPAYARADFDDSQWTLFDPSTSITKLFRANQAAP